MRTPTTHLALQHPALRALFAQLSAGLLVLLLSIASATLLDYRPSPINAGVLQAVLAALLGRRLGLPIWWVPINLMFVPALLLLNGQQLPASAFLGAFALLLLLNWNSLGERVPLYLTGHKACQQLALLLQPLTPEFRFIDLGCGLAGSLYRLSRRYPQAQFVGVETAPLVFAIAWLRCCLRPNCQIRYRSLWQEPLHSYDVVYCFLSPAPMSKLWDKARSEMRPNSRLISNTFTIAEAEATQIIDLHDWRSSRLLIWQL
jgi:SAM-dependent methyltransferase